MSGRGDAKLLTDGDVEGILVVGQSLAEGGCGTDVAQGADIPLHPANAWMLSPRPVGLAVAPLGPQLIPLREPSRVTVCHSLARHLVAEGLSRTPQYRLICSGQAWGGKSYRELGKGGSSGLFEMQVAQVAMIAQQVPGIVYRGIVCIHGEQDGLENTLTYAEDLARWQADLSEGIRSITKQSTDVPMFISQTSSGAGYGRYGGILDDSFPTPLLQLKANESNPLIHLVSPKYHLDYFDHSHLTNNAMRKLGEHFAKALLAVGRDEDWSPLRPQRIRAEECRIVIDFCGNDGPITFDTETVKPATHYGFSYCDVAHRKIESVAITGDAQVTIELDGPAGGSAKVAYAYNNGDGGALGQVAGRGNRGNLRDCSRFRSEYDGNPLYNWCVIFRKSVSVTLNP